MKTVNDKLLRTIQHSIDDANKICRRHCKNSGMNYKAYNAAVRLIRELREIQDNLNK